MRPARCRGGEELRDVSVNRGSLSVLRSLEQTARQHPAKRGRIGAEPVQRRKVVIGRCVHKCGALQAANQLKRTQPPGGVEQLGRRRVTRIRNPMFGIGFANELLARQLECSHPGVRPGSARNCVGQHFQVLGVCEQGVDTSLASRRDELLRTVDARVAAQNLAYAVVGQRVQTQDLDLAISRDHLQMGPVVGPEPVRLAAREAESGTPEPLEQAADAVQRSAPIRRPGPHLVKSVNEQGRASPLRAILEHQNVPGGDAATTGAFRFVLELRRFSGPWGAEQHVGTPLPKVIQGARLVGPGCGFVPAQQPVPVD